MIEKMMAEELSLDEICMELQSAERTRKWYQKSRNMVDNRLHATVAGSLGYYSTMNKRDRDRIMKEAKSIVKRVRKHEDVGDAPVSIDLIRITLISVDAFDDAVKEHEAEMVAMAKHLPAADLVLTPEFRGFGLLSLATLVGQCGNLSNYSNPSKIWKRLQLLPYHKDGKTLMGSTWRAKKTNGLSKEDWVEYSYAPRRRSVSYLFGDNIVKSNKGGPYREMYDRIKEEYARKHPDRMLCSKCGGTGKLKEGACQQCKGKGKTTMRAHRHAMLLATKQLVKDIWVSWHERV